VNEERAIVTAAERYSRFCRFQRCTDPRASDSYIT